MSKGIFVVEFLVGSRIENVNIIGKNAQVLGDGFLDLRLNVQIRVDK